MFEPVHGSAPDIAGQADRRPDRRDPLRLAAARPPRARRRGRRRRVRRAGRPRRPGRLGRRRHPAYRRGRRRDRRASSRVGAGRNTRSAGIRRSRALQRRQASERRHVRVSGRPAITHPIVTRGGLPCLPWRSAPPCTTEPVDDARLAEILANPGFGLHFTDHMFTVEWTPADGLARRPGHALRPAQPRPGDRRPALRPGDLRGHEGLPSRRRLDLDVPPRGQRRADGALEPAARALPELPPDDFVAAVDALVGVDRRWVPDNAGEKSLYVRPFMIATETFLGVRPCAARHVHGDRQPCRRLLQQGRQADHALADHRVHPRRPRRHGRGQDRRQLRLVPRRPAGGHGPRLRPGGLPRRPGGPVRRGARRDEHVLRLRRRPHRHPGHRHHPRGHHPLQHHRARRQARPPGRGAQVLHRRVARRA